MTSVIVRFNPILQLSDEQFLTMCRANPDVKFEQNVNGELIVVAPTGGDTGRYNSEINADFVIWNRRTQLGAVFDSSTCFKLPSGAKRSPDVAWVRRDRWEALTPTEREIFPPIAPDFVLELVSPSDSLPELQAKMQEYMDNGVQLGWLIDRRTRRVEIYRPSQPVEIQQNPSHLSGETILPGFVLAI